MRLRRTILEQGAATSAMIYSAVAKVPLICRYPCRQVPSWQWSVRRSSCPRRGAPAIPVQEISAGDNPLHVNVSRSVMGPRDLLMGQTASRIDWCRGSVCEFIGPNLRMRAVSLHPDVSPDDVGQATVVRGASSR
jgi:hypothetical protein